MTTYNVTRQSVRSHTDSLASQPSLLPLFPIVTLVPLPKTRCHPYDAMDPRPASGPFPNLSGLESLPPSVLFLICDHLARCSPAGEDLHRFSLASKTCFAAADPAKFRRLRVTAWAPEGLCADVLRWRGVLQTNQRHNHVRTLEILGQMLVPDVPDTRHEYQDMSRAISELSASWPHSFPWISGDSIPFLLPELPSTEGAREREDDSWLPLANLCRELPGLRDVHYGALSQMPRCLLSAIHQDHPTSRVFVHAFHLRSLVHPSGQPRAIDDVELALATSPCLHGIAMSATRPMDPQTADYNTEAVLDMVKGAAPNLVYVHHRGAYPETQSPRPGWQGFPGKARELSGTGHLRTLSLNGEAAETGGLVDVWGSRTDLRCLRTLEIGRAIRLEGLSKLAHAAGSGRLASLQSLYLNSESVFASEARNFDPTTAALLRSLPPLQHLSLNGVIGEDAFDAVLSHHAATLHTLIFCPVAREGAARFVLSPEQAQALSNKSLWLEHMILVVPRSQGSKSEVAIYRHLGALPRLKTLHLKLDCPVETLPEPDGEDDDQDDDSDVDAGTIYVFGEGRVSAPLVEKALRNTAVDERLAWDIFRILGQNKALCSLDLEPRGWFPGTEFGRWLRWIGRGWRISRHSPRTEARIMEVKPERRHQAERSFNSSSKRYDDPEWNMLKSAWDTVWPSTSESWWTEWSSMPLDEST